MSEGNGNAPQFGIRKNVKLIGRTDVAGGGQVVVENGYAFVGHMDPPHGTSILDVKDPKHPKVIAEIEIPQGVHSHKVRVSGDIMLVNLERYRSKEKQPTGLKVYDIPTGKGPKRSRSSKPTRAFTVLPSMAATPISRCTWKDTSGASR